MFSRSKVADFLIRSAIGLTLAIGFAFLLSEGSFLFLGNKETAARPPEEINLVIPYGTSKQVAEGVYNRLLPTTLTFVQGDVLIVKNEDTVAHQLGPIWVAPNTSSVLEMGNAGENEYECSFQPTNQMGLTVLPRVDNNARFQAILAIAMPTGMMLAVYSYLIPTKSRLKVS